MDTYFAPAQRANKNELAAEIEIVMSNSPIVSGLLHSVNGFLAVLDTHRQIVAINDSFLQMLGTDNPEETFGLRPGEVLECVHAHEEPAGCGTTEFCSTCGLATSIVSSLKQNKPVEKICALSATKNSKPIDMFLLVKAHPINIDEKRFLLLFLQDITKHQKRAAFERTFFHDVNNMLGGLIMASQMLVKENPSELAEIIHQASLRISKEVSIQQSLLQSEDFDYKPVFFEVTLEQILNELESFFVNHPVAHGKNITISNIYPDVAIKTDISLLLRVLYNMVTNAFEATPQNGMVKVWLEEADYYVSFCVWNDQEIPQEITKRIFQRNFSTKDEEGRGIGTYSMKLIGEKVLNGHVSFSTSKSGGTIFKFACPI
jgi:K+-sensing histidine kinase KdpD